MFSKNEKLKKNMCFILLHPVLAQYTNPKCPTKFQSQDICPL